MKPVKYLPKLEKSTIYTLNRYKKIIPTIDLRNMEESNLKMSFLIINFTNLISNFHKAFFLSCARNPKGSNRKTSICFHNYRDDNILLGMIITKYKPGARPKADGSWGRRDEPNRYDLEHISYGLSCIASLKLYDLRVVEGLSFSVYRDLPTFRNFYAHRNAKTQAAARGLLPDYVIAPRLHPTVSLLESPNNRSVSLIEDWMDEFEISVNILCQ